MGMGVHVAVISLGPSNNTGRHCKQALNDKKG